MVGCRRRCLWVEVEVVAMGIGGIGGGGAAKRGWWGSGVGPGSASGALAWGSECGVGAAFGICGVV